MWKSGSFYMSSIVSFESNSRPQWKSNCKCKMLHSDMMACFALF